jgi:uncharacterized SAM-binding protein YcdF (DUF218 family)
MAGGARDDGRAGRVRIAGRTALGLAGVLLVVGAAVVGRLFTSPAPAVPFSDGPIVVLGGGGDERLDTALEIRGSSGRPLVVSADAIERWEQREGDCTDLEVICMLPAPETTLGEAQTVGRLAEQLGWLRVTVVTSDFHTPRTRLLFGRCVSVPVTVVPAPTSPHLGERLYRIVRETVASVVALVRSDCR